MTITSEWIDSTEGEDSISKEVITSKVDNTSFLRIEICKGKDSDKYDSYKFTNQDGDTFICKSDEFIDLYIYFKTNGIALKVNWDVDKNDNN